MKNKEKKTKPEAENKEETCLEEEITEPIQIPSEEQAAEKATPEKDIAEEYKDMLQRLQAEFDNYRKRNQESVKTARNDGINEMILELLPVMDSFERGIASLDESAKSGMELICKQMSNLFIKYGVEEISSLGVEFDPNVHHAIAQCEDTENAGKIVEVFQKGYKRNNKVLRAALVKVAQ